jgi:hypothetical protein
VPEVLAYYRKGGRPDFGSSARERGRFTPGVAHDVVEAVRLVEGRSRSPAGSTRSMEPTSIRASAATGNHAYNTFAHHADQPFGDYLRLYRGLARLGFWRHPLFHASAVAVATVGPRRLQRLVHEVAGASATRRRSASGRGRPWSSARRTSARARR